MLKAIAVTALFVAMVFAGCQAPDENPYKDLPASCPSWVVNKSSSHYRWATPWNETNKDNITLEREELYGKGMEHNKSQEGVERPLDKFDIDLAAVSLVDAELVGKAYRGETSQRLAFRDLQGNTVDELRFGPGQQTGLEYSVTLTKAGDPPAPIPLRLVWTLEPDHDDDPQTDSGVYLDYTVHFLHLQEDCF